LFGERLRATIDVVVDRRLVSPDAVDVGARFAPFDRVGPLERTREDSGRTTLLRYAYPIQCVDRGCAPLGPRREFRLGAATLQYPTSTGIVTLAVPWPPLLVSSRLTAAELTAPAPRAELSEVPGLTYAVDPAVLGWLLGGAACLLVLGAGVWVWLRTRAPQAAGESAADEKAVDIQGGLELALGRVERAEGGVPERRLAVHALARELDDPKLAADARSLAWSAAPPSRDHMGELADIVRKRSSA
jgi:hypothetical protein